MAFCKCMSMSGQQVNLDKLSIFFSPNTAETVVEKTKNFLKIRAISGIDKYLGVPLAFGRSKKKHLGAIKNKMISKVRAWKEGVPSQVGRLILI